jgi:rhodanese-related sulfurtransferase
MRMQEPTTEREHVGEGGVVLRKTRTGFIWRTICEGMIVLVIGLGLALLANALSPRGLSLTRNYFPDVATESPGSGMAEASETADPVVAPTVDLPSPGEASAVDARLRQRGLEGIDLNEVQSWLADPRYEMELVILVDARNLRQYLDGHLPGAYSFDHFRPEETLEEVLPAALAAEQVIIYCSGGDCEDSEFAAIFLRDAGVPGDRIRIYTGGLQEWREAGLPMEIGQRGSGMGEWPN